MSEYKTQRELERIARAAESIDIRQEGYGKKHFLTGPRDDNDNLYWPDTLIASKSLLSGEMKMTTSLKVSGNNVRFTFDNGHGEYHVIGVVHHSGYAVMRKISSSIDHSVKFGTS